MADRSGWHFWPIPHHVEYVDVVEQLTDRDGNVIWDAGGQNNGIMIRIKHEWKADVGLYMHERAHAEVAFVALLLAPFTLGLIFLLTRSRRFRIWNEARAYARQAVYPNIQGLTLPKETLATFLRGAKYNFRLTQEEAIKIIEDHTGERHGY